MKHFFIALFFLVFETVFSQTIKIDAQFSSIKPISELAYLTDFENTLNASTIVKQNFKPVTKTSFGNKKGNYWFKLKIDNTTKETKDLFFDIREAIVNKLNVYKFEGNRLNLVYSIKSNQQLKNDHRIVQNLSIPITLSGLEQSVFYINIRFPKVAYFPITVRSEQNENKSVRYSLLRDGVYYGFVLMVLILNFFFFVSLKDATFLFYIAFLLAITSNLFYYDGFFYETLPEGRFLFHVDSYIHFFTGLTAALFATRFLQLPLYFKTINKIGMSILIIMAILYIIQVNTDNFLFLAIADTLGFMLLAIYWITGILILKKYVYARFFVLGYALVLFSTALYVIPLDFGFKGFGINLNHLKLGGIVEMLFLTYAITYRTKIMKNEYNTISLELDEYIAKLTNLKGKLGTSKERIDNVTFKIENLKTLHALTDRETEVLLCIAQHKTNKEIAEYLYLSVNTIKYHTRNIYEKLDINTRAAVRNKLKETL